MKPTSIRWLALVAAVTGVLAYLLLLTVYGSLPQVPSYGPVSLVFLAVAEGVGASSIRARLAGRPGTRPVEPLVVARLAALAKASALAGALMTGAYTGLLAYTLQHLDRRVYAHDAVASGFGAAAAVLLVVAALLLEQACKRRDVPPGVDNKPPREWDPLRDLHDGEGRPPTP
jgi:Protein of unknown function (DUF3180)